MGMTTKIRGTAVSGEVDVKALGNGAVSVFKRIPDMATLVYAGKVWAVQDQTTTAGLTAPPTTTVGLTIQNPATSARIYIVFATTFIGDVMPASAEGVYIWHCTQKLAGVALTRDISLQATGAGAIMGLAALQGAYDGSVVLDRGATCVDDGWCPISPIPFAEAASNVDWSQYIALQIPVIIPPGGSYCVAALVTEATIEVGHGFVWAEVEEEDLV